MMRKLIAMAAILWCFVAMQAQTETVRQPKYNNCVQMEGGFGMGTAGFVYGVDVMWKTKIDEMLYFGVGVGAEGTTQTASRRNWSMIEVGVPIKFEYTNLSRRPAFFGSVGVTPAYYRTTSENPSHPKPNGIVASPIVEGGINLPSEFVICRVGLFVEYKIDCTASDYNPYARGTGRAFAGAKFGVMF